MRTPTHLLPVLLLVAVSVLSAGCSRDSYQNKNANISTSSSNQQFAFNSQAAAAAESTPKAAAEKSADAIVISTRANLREAAKSSSVVVTEAEEGDELVLVQQLPAGVWYKVRHLRSGKQGWIHGNTIRLTKTTESPATARSEPDDSTSANSNRAVSTPSSRSRGGTSYGRDTYTNVDGEEVPRPRQSETVPAGASARCRDGSYSFSRNRRGTCSHHGGVAQWL